jgi:hypothetical protein
MKKSIVRVVGFAAFALISVAAIAGTTTAGSVPVRALSEQDLIATGAPVVDQGEGFGKGESATKQTLSLSANVEGVKCTVSNDKGSWSVVTPATVDVERSADDLKVTCSKDGYETVAGVLHSAPTEIEVKHFSWTSDEDAHKTVQAYAPGLDVSMKSTVASN